MSDFEDALIETPNTKIYLDVPYDDSKYAKELNAKWDKDVKKWYTTKENKNYKKLKKQFKEKKKIYLNVPYDEKDEAKSLGARWCTENKKWYTYKDKQDLFDKWLTNDDDLDL